jgi:ATP synthase protein I
MSLEKIGRYAFILGLVISVIAGVVNVGTTGIAALVILGVIVGFLNVTGKETGRFLIGAVALILVGVGGSLIVAAFGETLVTMLNHFVAFIMGATLIVALKEVYSVTSTK